MIIYNSKIRGLRKEITRNFLKPKRIQKKSKTSGKTYRKSEKIP